jgi:hypothetical protein
LSLNDNLKPFPFSEFPKEMDTPDSEIRYQ